LLNEENDYTIWGEIYNIEKNKEYKITRLIKKEKEISNTNLQLKTIDDNENSKIKLEYVSNNKIYYGKITSRTYATLKITPNISEDIQKKIARKMISFDLAYKIVGMLLQKYTNK